MHSLLALHRTGIILPRQVLSAESVVFSQLRMKPFGAKVQRPLHRFLYKGWVEGLSRNFEVGLVAALLDGVKLEFSPTFSLQAGLT